MAVDWKNEEDVREYLENLGIEYRFQCYYEKKPDGCHRLGDFLEAVKKDFKKAAIVYKRNCEENNYGKSCYKFGGYVFLGKGDEKVDKLRAFEYFMKGCEKNNPESCFHAGAQLTSKKDDSVPKNYPLGLQLLEKACSQNDQFGCYYASGLHFVGAEGVPKDMKKAFIYSEKACDLGNMYACANVSQMYTRGEGVQKNEKLGAEYKAKALDLQTQFQKKLPTIAFEQGT
ncbi:cytochrome c oxidase assembly factor 7 homolog [Centruroides sculpturatus]|uniref:cytochrome c oxidase assembly factor 7 homolog n=1 Tax=Centruroides sculpturatus TaxID=218467 RepID=UPI000C6D532A|nr:cytochrome c oxidase assembly factor 7 homolog [Centruroides sculpturatus]